MGQSKRKPTPKPVVDATTTGGASRKRSPRAKDPNPRSTTRMTYERRKKAGMESQASKPGGPTDSIDAAGTKNLGRAGKFANAGSWQPGQSGNPKGAPRRGESWREMVKSVGDKTLAEALERYPWLVDKIPDKIRPYATVNDTLTLKEVVVANVFGQLIEAPDSALWNGLMNRAEGNPEQPVERTWKAELAEWLRDEKVTMDEIRSRLSDELFNEFTVYIGAAVPGAR